MADVKISALADAASAADADELPIVQGGVTKRLTVAELKAAFDADDIDDTSTANKFATAAELTKLAGIEAGADVTDATNVDAAGALMKAAGGDSVEDVGAIESNVSVVAATGAAETLDTSLYGVFDVTMDQNCTFTFSNPAPSGKATIFTLILRGAFTPTWPASVDWPDATQPTYGTPTVYTFLTRDNGTTWLGMSGGKSFG